MSNPIFVLSTSGDKITYATGVVRNEELIFLKIGTITGIFRDWKVKAKKKLAEAAELDMTIIIEDRLNLFPDYFSVDLGAPDPHDGRTYQNIAMDQYMGLASMGDTTTQKSGGETYTILGALVFTGKTISSALRPNSAGINVDYDDKGRPKYDLEASLTGAQRCLMLTTLAAGGIVLRDKGFADELFGALEDEYGSMDGDQYSTPGALKGLLGRTDHVVDISALVSD